MDDVELVEHRKAKDEFFANDHHSPIPPESRHRFKGLSYYPPNSDMVFRVPVGPADSSEILIQTTDGQERVYRRAGTVNLEIEGKLVDLTLFSSEQPGYFLPFRDATSGTETYGAGRYLEIEQDEDGFVQVDFNRAYNPFCVYDEAYSCPLPPPENWLRVPVRAGERDFELGE